MPDTVHTVSVAWQCDYDADSLVLGVFSTKALAVRRLVAYIEERIESWDESILSENQPWETSTDEEKIARYFEFWNGEEDYQIEAFIIDGEKVPNES